MRLLGLLVCLLLVPSPLTAAPTLKEARERWLRGNYEEARAIYEELAKDPKQRAAAAIGLSQTWQSQGELDKALVVIDQAITAEGNSSDLLARRAELLYGRGRWDEAEKAVEQALALKKDHFAARWVRAQIARDRGDFKKADAEFRWFVRTYTERNDKDQDIKNPDELLLVGLSGCENARWNNLGDQFQFVLSEVYGDALRIDKNYWPAEYEAGVLLLEKYNRGDALAAFDKVLTVNPQAAEAYVGKGIAALQKLEIKDAEQFAERALKINPRLVAALNLRADVHLATGAITKALRELEEARKVNPRDENTLGRIAACMLLQRQRTEFDQLTKEVASFNSKAGLFYFVVADRLEDRRWYEKAETFYKKAIELRSNLPWPRNSLGLLYMRLGREDEARKILTQAFADDEFNVRVANSLKVLRHLEKYATLKTEHFILRYDAQRDELLGQYMAKFLEEVYEELAKDFNYRPKGPFLIEVLNNHEMFSGRTIALPDLHTIGACTGRMVAMVSPRGRDIRKPFNWARVIRHELVHVFNLEQTHFLVPHWFTEGLAVIHEHYPRPQQWNDLLLERVPAGEVMNLDTIDLGFVRPRTPADWHMAYCQSQLYVEYIQKKAGPKSIGAMLAAYADHMDTEAAIAKVCGINKDEFEKGYREYLHEVVRSMGGRPSEKPMTFRELRDAHEKSPGNLDLAARLAEFYLKRDNRKALELATEVLEKKKNHPRATYVRASLYCAGGEDEKALQILRAVHDPKRPDPKVLQLLGKLYFESKQIDKATAIYESARKLEPYDSRWLTDLAKIYSNTGENEKLIAVLKDLVLTDADDLDQRKRLARLLLDAARFAEAEASARQALEIDVVDPEAQQCLGEALLAQKKYSGAVEALQIVVILYDKTMSSERSDDARLKLAQAYSGDGQKQKAMQEVVRILARDPENMEAMRLKAALEKK